MKEHHCVSQYGEHFIIRENDEGVYLCPVCGSAEFDEPPYDENGSPSFQMCSCGFEYGFAKHGVRSCIHASYSDEAYKIKDQSPLQLCNYKRIF